MTQTNDQYLYVDNLYAKDTDILSVNHVDILSNELTKCSSHTMCEYIQDNMVIKPYFDKDCYLNQGETLTKKAKKDIYDECKGALVEFLQRFPGLTFNSNVAIAQRHGKIIKKNEEINKISYRFFIVGIKTNLDTMRNLFESSDTLKDVFDRSPYNNNRKMAMLYGHKGGSDNRQLVPEREFSREDKCLKDYIIQHVEPEWPMFIMNTKRKSSPDIHKNVYSQSYIHKEVSELVMCLSDERADDEQQWVQVGWCLHNIKMIDSDFALNLWIDFSKRSDKFTDGECEKKWKSFRNDGYNIGSLHLWARQDDPLTYKTIIGSRVSSDIRYCDGTHNTIAKIMYEVLKERFVCASTDCNLWYHYNGRLWKEDADRLELKKQFSCTLLPLFERHSVDVRLEAPVEDLDSDADTSCTVKRKLKQISKIKLNLKNHNFKKQVLNECVEFFYNEDFLKKIDANPNLLGFNNGVYHLKERIFIQGDPSDYVSLSTGFDYIDTKNEYCYEKVKRYFETIHPSKEQRLYILKTYARQLFGDNGRELFHIHCGHRGSAANGKTKSWEINQICFGDYVKKFDVSLLVNPKRKESNAPSPEFSMWKGSRLLYCTEPNPGETLNSGYFKTLTGGERVVYRMLFSSCQNEYTPQYKLHIMTNDLPNIDGTDEGIKRRVRVLPYISSFVDKDKVNHDKNMFEADPEVVYAFQNSDEMRMEYVRYILEHYDHTWDFKMTHFIQEHSKQYLYENDNIGSFVSECMERDYNSFVTLKELKELYKRSEFYDGKLSSFRTRIERVLGVRFIEQKTHKNVKYSGVFEGYRIVQNTEPDVTKF